MPNRTKKTTDLFENNSKRAFRLRAQVQDSLEGVEHRFRETAHKAVRIGDRLSKMEGQRARAAEAMDLLGFFEASDFDCTKYK